MIIPKMGQTEQKLGLKMKAAGGGERMASRKTVRRICLVITPELDRKIVDLRKKPEYERKSLSEIARMMMERGIAMET